MHEITLCQRALELIPIQAAKHGAKRVTGVWLKIGGFASKPALLPFVLIWFAAAAWRKVVNCTSKNKRPNAGVKHANSM